ncbi:MAG: DUF2950 domain-containing protein [Burkholderiales bacterium]|nr:DUF2950 domain-containing protein [Burkholderiales bacterium]
MYTKTFLSIATLAAFALSFAAGALAASPQQTFASPDDAVAALIAAVKANDVKAMRGVLGNAEGALSSGDKVADRAAAQGFVADFDAKHSIARDGDTAKLVIGKEDFPFAFPLVKTGDRWRFDTAAGVDELKARRIGENELSTIKVLQAIVDAQREYASVDRDGDGVVAYARKLISSPGKHDGLFWPTKAGEKASPLGPLVADAAAEGYGKDKGKGAAPRPFHGYYFRALKGQAAGAAGPGIDYVVHGRQIGGFAVIAYPAKYASSGIMTFIVNQDGKVYQRDLGPDTHAKAAAIQRFDPGKGWSPASP